MRIYGLQIWIFVFGLSFSCCAQTIELPATAGTINPPFFAADSAIVQTNDTTFSDGGSAIYSFSITNAGDYVIFAVAGGKPGKNCAVRICIDQETEDPENIWVFDGNDGVKHRAVGSARNVVGNRNYKIFSLETGTHQLLVRGSTAGTRIEKFYIRRHTPPRSPASPPAVK